MATEPHLIISSENLICLKSLFFGGFASVFSDKPYLRSLRTELSNALILSPDEIPSDVVTMNSTVRLRGVRSEAEETFTLVYPMEANIAAGKLSVLAPIGTTIIGRQVGDIVRWPHPAELLRFKIEELVYQPERNEFSLNELQTSE